MCLKTNNLFIRKIMADDWRELKNIAIDFRKSKYAIYDMPLPIDDAKIKQLTIQFAESGLWFAVVLKDTIIGYICFHNQTGVFDLGFCFHSDYQGKGYAYKSCRMAIDDLQRNYHVQCITAGTALNNIPACKLLKRLGFTLKETEILSFHKDKNGNDILFTGGNFIKDHDRRIQMNIEKIQRGNKSVAVITSNNKVMTDVSSALDLIMTAKYEAETNLIAIEKEAVAEEFFILSSGLAGELLQKFINYQAKLAIYGDYSKYTSKPLKDFIYESNKGKDIFFVSTKEEAAEALLRAE